MNSWKKLTEKNKKYLCRFEVKNPTELEKDMNILESIIKKYSLVDFTDAGQTHPVAYVLKEGNMRTQRCNPENKMPFFNRYLFENPKLLDYPLIDHANYFRDSEHKAYLITNTYCGREEIAKAIEDIRLIIGYENLMYDIKDESYYSKKTLCVILYML